MRKLSPLILLLIISVTVLAQPSPHGAGFKVNCLECHSTTGWSIDMKTLSFNHGSTKFPLVGQHQAVSCKQCHISLEFGNAGTECIDCHTDMHNQTVGPDCGRCHTPNSWVINNITEMHQRSRFPLVGIHVTTDCFNCHKNASASLLNFGPLGIECIDCHQHDYESTTNPDHEAANFSNNCIECHNMTSVTWAGAGFNHNTFPLTLGHEIANCQECHKTPEYSSTSPVCVTCHQSNYNSTANPNHLSAGFSTTCQECHTTNPGWKPAEYREHDSKSFPIYSGKHAGTWNICAECHLNAASYAQFTCIDCHDHNQPDMNNGHDGVQGYAYNSPSCFACHPTGSKEGSFNHATSAFPLTGAHGTTACVKCHINGYTGTSALCFSCHAANYNQSTNPNHLTASIPTACETCHSTTAWVPATFNHSKVYPLTGAHATIAGNCFACHQGNYVNTPNTCAGCHMPNFNATTNPDHAGINIPTDCISCHTTNPNWTPASFPIHSNYYLLQGAHAQIANNCFDCHKGNYNSTPNTCAGCHLLNYNQTTNPPHSASQFPTTCTDCHSQNAWSPANWNHDGQYFPIYSGKHNGRWNTCADCHTNPANYGVFTCTTACHPSSSTNNDHREVTGYSYNSAACYNCHPTGSAGGKTINRIDGIERKE
jgi:hypothetical protein